MLGSVSAALLQAAELQQSIIVSHEQLPLDECCRCLVALTSGCDAARQQLAGVWQSTVLGMCRALPPHVLQRVLPTLALVTNTLRDQSSISPAAATAVQVPRMLEVGEGWHLNAMLQYL